jgi:hypothetical protein
MSLGAVCIKVYAIEASDIADQAELVFKKNNVSDRAKIFKGKVEVSAECVLTY